MLSFVREGDTIVCHSMDRLGRNLDDLRTMVFGLTARGVHVRFVKESLTFTGEDFSRWANLLLSVMDAVPQFERELIRERQREGIELAKKAGAYRGRKHSLTTDRAAEMRLRLGKGENKSSRAREFGVGRTTTIVTPKARADVEHNSSWSGSLKHWEGKSTRRATAPGSRKFRTPKPSIIAGAVDGKTLTAKLSKCLP